MLSLLSAVIFFGLFSQSGRQILRFGGHLVFDTATLSVAAQFEAFIFSFEVDTYSTAGTGVSLVPSRRQASMDVVRSPLDV